MTTKVTSRVLATDAAGVTQVANDAVDTAAIVNLNVTEAKLATGAVTETKLGAGAVSEAKLADGAVTTAKLGALAVTDAKLAVDAVTTTKIDDLAVTTDKLADSAVTLEKMDIDAINTAQLINLAVTDAKIADATITEGKLAFTANAAGLNTIWIPTRAIYPSATNGTSAIVLSFSSDTKPSIPCIMFSTSVKQYAEFCVYMPKSYDQGDVKLSAIWTHPSTTTNFGVRWEFSKLHVGDGATLDSALGTIVGVTDTGGSTSYLYKSGEVTLTGGSPTIGKMAFFKIARDVAHTDDNLAVAAYLLGVVLTYTTDKANDD